MQISKVNNTFQTENKNINAKKQNKSKKFPNIKETLGAASIASVVQAGLVLPSSVVSVKGVTGAAKNLTEEQVLAYNNAANSVLNSSGLKKAGVKIHDLSRKIANTYKNPVEELLSLQFDPIEAAIRGKNAFFSPMDIGRGKILCFKVADANSVLINMKKLPTAVFHEMGHAHNFNYSKIGSFLQKSRTASILISSILLLIAACSKEEKAEDGKELTKGQKAKNGVRKSLPVMSFVAMLPVVLEEGLASFKGNKWAKKVLSPDLYKKVFKGNLAGFVSYVGAALATAGATYAAIKVKDKLVEKKEAKLKAQQETSNPKEVYSTTA